MENNLEVLIKPLSGGAFAIALLNPTREPIAKMELKWSEVPQLKGDYVIHDIWDGRDIGDTTRDFVGAIKSHDVKVFKLTRLK